MKKNPTKRLLGKIDKTIPGFSEIVYPKLRKKITKKQNAYLDFGSNALLHLQKTEKANSKERKPFSKLVQRKVLEYQQYRCKLCGKKSDILDFDHIDGKSYNNDTSNCQALCPNCHAKKTRKGR